MLTGCITLVMGHNMCYMASTSSSRRSTSRRTASYREFARDPYNHCVPLLDIIRGPPNCQNAFGCTISFLRLFKIPFPNHLASSCRYTILVMSDLSDIRRHDLIPMELWIRISDSCTSETLHTGEHVRPQIDCTFRRETFWGRHNRQDHPRPARNHFP